jgi:excisionase family DNA binding protein
MDRWMTSKEAASYLRVTLNRLHKLTSNEDIPFSRIGRSLRFDRLDLDAWMRSRRVEAS